MDHLLPTKDQIFCHLRQNHANKKVLQVVDLLERVDKFGCENENHKFQILEQLLELFASVNLNTDETVNGNINFAVLLTYLQEEQKLPCLNKLQFESLWEWLLHQYKCHNNYDQGRTIIVISNLLVTHTEYSNKYVALALKMLLKYINFDVCDVLLITTLQCLYKIFSTLKDFKLSEEQCAAACADVGTELLRLHYNQTKLFNIGNILIFNLRTFQILLQIVALDSNFASEQAGKLLGLAKAYFRYGIDGNEAALIIPQKVNISHQGVYDSPEQIESEIHIDKAVNCGGKTPKKRKLRAVVKNTVWNDCFSTNTTPENRYRTFLFDLKASDSEVSEPENGPNRILFQRNRKAKIRLASINLVGSTARALDRKALFGYWHALLPSGSADNIDNLLYVSQHDPNIRCRSAALQVCCHLLYGSEAYLRQAEVNIKRCPTTFIPFSVSLGYTLLAIYQSITTILSSESSLAVLTQALKCLAVLVQASTIKQFECGFVQDFVKYVKPLVYHRDAAIQVSALMVMEFLLAMPDTTPDIAEAIDIPDDTSRKRKTNLRHVGEEEIAIVDTEEFVESDEDICLTTNTDEPVKNESLNAQNVRKTSWLLKRVLNNLRTNDKKVHATSVRIESLQVLTVMSSRFAMIKQHLANISEVLRYTLKDVLPDVRLYAARCVDACTYQISSYLIDGASDADVICECKKFWLELIPFIMSRICRDSEDMTMIRITLCDALSNIGALMFEQIPHSSHICLLSFLSGVSSDSSEEILVRSAAARALAVFALYPSLRGDLVFLENTAELTLCLIKDSNLLVRVKSFWSLGNISDALIENEAEISQLRQERISDDLLFRLITAATVACSDNDKVRCNAVRTLGNLLRLLRDKHFNIDNSKMDWHQAFAASINKLSDCLRSSGNAKVKWNTCYAISNLMRNPTIFKLSDLKWQGILFPVLCDVIVHHPNFKVRINASPAITNISKRIYFGSYYENFLSSVLKAIEHSYNLDNFYEYNHRDNLQEQLCLSLSHIIRLAANDDLTMLKKYIFPQAEIIRNTYRRVINRMVPEKAAPLLTLPVVLLERLKHSDDFSAEQKNILHFLIELLSAD